mgnify:CR=1 FL=1
MAKNQPAKQQAEGAAAADASKADELVTGELVDGASAPFAADTPIIDPEALASAGAATVTAIAPETVRARVLVDGAYGKANDVVDVPAAEAEISGELDAHPDAVAYALSLVTE